MNQAYFFSILCTSDQRQPVASRNFHSFFFLSLSSFQTKKRMKRTISPSSPPPSHPAPSPSGPSLTPCFQDWDYLKRQRVLSVAKLGTKSRGFRCASTGVPEKRDQMKWSVFLESSSQSRSGWFSTPSPSTVSTFKTSGFRLNNFFLCISFLNITRTMDRRTD